MNTLPFEIQSDLDVTFAIVHPHLCGTGGNEVLSDVLRSAERDPDTYVLVGACAPEAQKKLFKKTFRETGFPQDHFLAVDIRNTTNDGILDRLRERLEELSKPKKPH